MTSIFSYIHWHPNPEIVKFGGLSLRYYSVLFATGILLSFHLLRKRFQQQGIADTVAEKLFIYVVLGTFLGARVGHCLFYEPGYFLQHPWEILLPWEGLPWERNFRFTGYRGLASHGAALGILIAIRIFTKKARLSYLVMLDGLAPFVPLTGAFIRLGNLFNSEILGTPSHVAWAFIFDREDNIPRHPAQLYEAICYLILFFLLYRLSRKSYTNSKRGALFGVLLMCLFSIRFILEFFKADQVVFEAGMWLNMGQLLSLPLIIAGVFLFLRKKA